MPLRIAPLTAEGAPSALRALSVAEESLGLPLVDEAERLRLERLVEDGSRPDGWTPIAVRLAGQVVGYGAVQVDEAGRAADGDAAVTHRGDASGVLSALLDALADAARAAGVSRVQVWVRHAGEDELAAARQAGFTVERRLGVLGSDLVDEVQGEASAAVPDAAHDEVPAPGAGVEIRAFRPDEDDEAVVAILAAAYESTDEAGWGLARFRERRGWPWFRAEDLLVAELEDGRLGGLHWLKRRGDGAGEVYNLAVHPAAQGRGLGPALLDAGLEHLRRIGCREVLLWVDLANERAVRLYTSQGFVTRWEDVALVRTLVGPETL